ncbi:MAG: hypothetical protein CL725_07465 [Chloroflexi bacterium]|nr:hypothetical protein [Chloroflexota bacterium]
MFEKGEPLSWQADGPICVHSGFCCDTVSDIWSMRRQSSDSEVLAQIIDKLDNCPSGALAYALENGDETIEPDLAKEVFVIRRLEMAE